MDYEERKREIKEDLDHLKHDLLSIEDEMIRWSVGGSSDWCEHFNNKYGTKIIFRE